MTLKENNLALACRQTEDAAGRLVHWVQSNAERVGPAGPSLVRELEARRTTAKMLARSASRPPAIGVAGPSSVGKSLVVGGLARPESGRITVQFAGLPYGVDYLAYVEPGEASLGLGMATRLSPRPRSTPPGFPIPVRLLSVADIARILASVYFGDAIIGGATPLDRETVRRVCRQAGGETAPYPIPGLTTRDVLEIRDYLETYFGDDPIVRMLATTEYWEVLSQSAPKLTDTMRAELLALLWPGMQELTALFRELVDALGRLGHSAEAFVPLESIVDLDAGRGAVGRSRSSLLDATCQMPHESVAGDLVVVHGQKGHKPAIPRAALAGIVAEVRFTLASPPGAGLAEAEIIEFPCLGRPQSSVDASSTIGVRCLYMKAKALYLLQRNAQERELTSLVVCADEQPIDLGRFPEVLSEWVELVHGTGSHEREAVDASLFIALVETSDAAVGRTVGELAPQAEWSSRLSHELFETLSAVSSWPDEWTPGRPFDNVFLLHQPRTSSDTARLIAPPPVPADGGSAAVPTRADGEQRTGLPRIQTAAWPDLQPSAARDQGSGGDDGGLTYLNRSVAGISNGFNRHRQVSQALSRLRATCAERLRRYNGAEDIFTHREGRHRAALIATARLMRAAQSGRFGHVIRALQVPSTDLAALFETFAGRDAAAAADAPVASLPAADGPMARSPRAAQYAGLAIGHWIASMRAMAANPRLAWENGISSAVMGSIVDELVDAADRLRLGDGIARALGRIVIRELDADAEGQAAAVLAADAIADHVRWLGYRSMADERRPRRRGTERTPIFAERQRTGAAALGAGAEDDDRYHLDWCQGFVAVVEDNVAALFERRSRGEADLRLGDVLRNLESSPAEAQP